MHFHYSTLSPSSPKEEAGLLCPALAVLTDVVYGSCTEFAVELFGAEAPQVVDGEWPQVQHVIAGKGIPLLYDHHLGSQEGQVDGCTKATGSSPDYQTLQNKQHRVSAQSLEEMDIPAAASQRPTALRDKCSWSET